LFCLYYNSNTFANQPDCPCCHAQGAGPDKCAACVNCPCDCGGGSCDKCAKGTTICNPCANASCFCGKCAGHECPCKDTGHNPCNVEGCGSDCSRCLTDCECKVCECDSCENTIPDEQTICGLCNPIKHNPCGDCITCCLCPCRCCGGQSSMNRGAWCDQCYYNCLCPVCSGCTVGCGGCPCTCNACPGLTEDATIGIVGIGSYPIRMS